MNTAEKRAKRAQLIHEARALSRKPKLDAQDLEQAERLMDEARRLLDEIEREENALSESMGSLAGRAYQPTDFPGSYSTREYHSAGASGGKESRASEAYLRHVFNLEMTADQRQELRSLYHGLDTAGGYLTPPMDFVNDVLVAVAANVPLMQYATILDVQGSDTLGVPTVENEGSDASWTTELQIGNEDNVMSFGRRELRVHPLAKYIKVSRDLLRRAPTVQTLVVDLLGRKVGAALETAFTTGDGSGKPLGLFVASDQGIPTSRDVSEGNTVNALTFDGLINAIYSVPSQYRPRCRWLMHDDVIKHLRKITDGDDNYVWQPSVISGQPDTLFGYEVVSSAYAPNTFEAGQYLAIFGDLSYYWIGRELGLEVQVAQELFLEHNQVGMIVRASYDGAPVLPEAFARVQLAAQ